MHNEFYKNENASRAVDLGSDQDAQAELDELVRCTLKDGVTIVAVEKSSGRVVGAAINKIQVRMQILLLFPYLEHF